MTNSAADCKALVTRYVDEVLNKGNVAAMDELISPRIVDHHPNHRDLAEVKAELARLREVVPGMRYAIEDMVAEDGKVAVRLSLTARLPQRLSDVPFEGRTVKRTALHMLQIEDSKIVSHWSAEMVPEL